MSKIIFWLFLSVILVISCKAVPSGNESIQTGADQTQLYLPMLKEKAVALVANHTSRIGNSHLADSLIAMKVELKKIFSPEHGFRGEAGAGDLIGNTIDPNTGISVISLYGSHKKPTAGDMEGIDLVIYDIQDVGVRFYTYISTLHYVMEACAERKVPLIVLDRPNPLGFYIDGPVLDTNYRSFVGMHPIPVVYGMTAGELASMINGEGWLSRGMKCDLTIIPCGHYHHDSTYNLPVHPSPNLNSMEAVYLYPSLCFFEGTVMSLGRGTDFPFRVVGHPAYPQKDFSFTPRINAANQNPVFLDKTCYGLDLRALTTDELRQMERIKLQWLIEVFSTMDLGDQFFTDYVDRLAGTSTLRMQIQEGLPGDKIRESWQDEIAAFKTIRQKYLIYDDFSN